MRIHVAIASVGRASTLKQTITRLARQTRRADGIVVVGSCPEDVAGLENSGVPVEIIIAPKGLCKQRNKALDRLRGHTDAVVFFDDDFVAAHDYLENVEKIFSRDPGIVGLTGHLVYDGAKATPIGFSEAERRLDVDGLRPSGRITKCTSLYGCNMAFLMAEAEGLRFDEALPLYGWQEDVDFTHQLSWRGKMLTSAELTGIHLGTPGGRTSGLRLGYSQIANLVYLWRKGTMRPWLGERLLLQNVTANILRSLWPEPQIDRRGRLAGNMLAFMDLIRGRIDPRRIDRL